MKPEEQVCAEILRIMATYHEQEQSPSGVDTPGGLEHMGDVWRLLAKWERMLLEESHADRMKQPGITRGL